MWLVFIMMATYVLIHGAGSDSWYWHLVAPRLRSLGHDVVTVDLPCDNDDAGLEAYADTVVEAVGDRRDLIVVAQSLAGFTAPLVCDRLPVTLLVLVKDARNPITARGVPNLAQQP